MILFLKKKNNDIAEFQVEEKKAREKGILFILIISFLSAASFWGYETPLLFYFVCCIGAPFIWIFFLSEFNSISVTFTELLLFIFIGFLFFHTSVVVPQYLSNYKIQVLLLLGIIYIPIKRIMMEDDMFMDAFLCFYFILGIIIDGYSYLQYGQFILSANPQFRITGIFYNPGILAIYQCAILITATIVYLYPARSKTLKALSLIAFFSTLPLYLYCFSRASFLGLLISILVLICRFRRMLPHHSVLC